MRCRTCGSKAVINMPQHRLALCKAHYLEWLPAQTQRDISKYKMFDQIRPHSGGSFWRQGLAGFMGPSLAAWLSDPMVCILTWELIVVLHIRAVQGNMRRTLPTSAG